MKHFTEELRLKKGNEEVESLKVFEWMVGKYLAGW